MLQSRSDSPYMYIFIDLHGGGGCILYRIDALEHLHNDNKLDDTQLNNLHPLLVFPESLLPFDCHIAKLGSNFYFLGGRVLLPTFGIKGAKHTDVYMLRESDLMDIDPSEHNTNAEKYLIKTGSMNGRTNCAKVFVADNKLYVLDMQFEVYSPESETWRILPPHPYAYPKYGVISYVVVGKTVYFSLYGDGLLSFQLDKEKWGILVVSPPLCPNLYFEEPSLTSPLVITGDKVLGFLNDSLIYLTVCASPLPQDGEFTSPEFMRPSIAPTDDFLNDLDSSRCPHGNEKSEEFFSGYMIALDGVDALCVISYGSSSVSGNEDDWLYPDRCRSYATLTFFQVTPGFYRGECGSSTRNVDYANEKVDGEYVATRYFRAKLLHIAQFVIKTSSIHTWGQIKACFY